MLVRVPGNAAAVKAFTDADIADAVAYAESTGGYIDPLPVTGT